MKKILLFSIFLGNLCYAQVGINTDNPNATLDIQATSSSGSSTNNDGILIPRIDRQRAQSMANPAVSTLVYINNIATGTLTGKTDRVNAVGFYYFDGTRWVKLENPSNATDQNTNIYNVDGSLTGNRIVTQGTNTLAFTGTAANAFSVDNTTFSVNASNDRVGIGTTNPQSKLHVAGQVRIADGTQGANKIFVSNADGVGSWVAPEETKLLMSLTPTEGEVVLNGVVPGGTSFMTKFVVRSNTIPNASFANNIISLPAGVYEVNVSLEMNSAPANCSTITNPAGFLINSYFIDFPTSLRVHSNSSSICGTNSVNHGHWTTTFTVPSSGANWRLHIGRGVGGNYSGGINLSTFSTILVKKIY